MVVAPPLPQRLRAHVSRRRRPASGRCRPARAEPIASLSASSLSGYQRSSWSLSATSSASGGTSRQGALEVPVEAQVRLGAREHEPRVARDDLGDRLEALGLRAVVADQADPVAVGLGADRLDLGAKELDVRVEGGHADRDQGLPGRAGQVVVRRGSRAARRPRSCRARRVAVVPSASRASTLSSRLARSLARPDRDRRPEAAAVGAKLGISRTNPGRARPMPPAVGRERRVQLPEAVEPRHPLRRRPVSHAVDDDRQVRDALMAMEAGADAEDGRCAGRPAGPSGSGRSRATSSPCCRPRRRASRWNGDARVREALAMFPA